jgi:hypothetical protein
MSGLIAVRHGPTDASVRPFADVGDAAAHSRFPVDITGIIER